MSIELPLNGCEFKQVRVMLDYTAREVAEHLAAHGLKPATVRGIYAMEEYRTVRSSLIPHLASLFGAKQFERAVALVRAMRKKQRDDAEAYRQQRLEDRARQAEECERLAVRRRTQSELLLDQLEAGLGA